jgi:hypothetical protein
VANVVRHRVLSGKRKSFLANACCLENLTVSVEAVNGLLNRMEVVLTDGWTADQITEVEESCNCFHHLVWYVSFDGREIYLQITLIVREQRVGVYLLS